MKNMAQVELSAWSLAEEAPEGTDLGSLCAPATKKALPGVMGRAALVPGQHLQPSLAAELTGEPRWYSPVKGHSLKVVVCLPSFSREGNDTPLQYSCLENPMDGGGWWAAVYGVAQSQTRLK